MTDDTPTRYALVKNARRQEEVERYLPDNYRVVHTIFSVDEWKSTPDKTVMRATYVIQGEDVAGWTLDGYVIPRLASGLIHANEVELSHPMLAATPVGA